MMKKLIFSLALAACMATGASAQESNVKLSVNAGPQWNDQTGFLVGVDASIPFGESRWGFEPGVYYSFRNVSSDNSEGSVKAECNDKLHYINVPLRLSVRVAGQEDGPFKMSLLFGPYLSYGLSGKSHYTITKDGVAAKEKYDAFSDKGHLESRLDYGLNVGLSAVIKQHFKVGVFTEIGLKDIYKENSVAEDLVGDLFGGITKVNLGGGITVGYQF